MNGDVLLGLVINTALLLALVVLYETIPLHKTIRSRLLEIFTGILVGSVGLAVMLTPWHFSDGVVFDTRSILLSVTGLFFGGIPTSIAVLMTGALRLYQGGDGALMGVSVILSSAGLGLFWRYALRFRKKTPAWYELYIFGVIVHLVMLLCTNLLPLEIGPVVLEKIALPVMLIYPIGTVLLGQTLLRRDQRAQLEQALRTGTARFRSLFDNSPIAIWEEDFSLVKEQFDILRRAGITDFKMYWKEYPQEIGRLAGLIHIIEVNLASVKLLGAENREQIKRNLPDYFIEESLAVFEDEMTALAEGQTEFKCEIPVRNIRGERTVLDLTLTVQPGCEETLERVLLSFLDITERKQAEEELRRNEEKFRNLFNNSEVGMFRTRLDGSEILEFNEKYLKILNYSFEEIKNLPSRELWADKHEREILVERIKVEGRVTDYECGLLNKQGETRRCIMSLRLYRDTEILEGSIHDITERKQAEESIQQRVKELETINQISLALRSVSKQDEMLSIVLDDALAILNTSHGSIELYNKATDKLEKIISRGWFARIIEPPQAIHEGIAGKVFTSGLTSISHEFAADPEVRATVRTQIPPGWGGVCLPIRTAQQTLGVMIVAVPSERGLNVNEIRLLSILSEMTGAAMQRMGLHDQTVHRLEQLKALRDVDQAISNSRDMQLTLKILLAHTLTNLGMDAADVLFMRPGSNFLELAADLGFHTLLFNNVNLSDSVSGRAILEDYPVMPLDSETVKLCKNPQFLKFWEEEGFSGYWCVPLRVKGEVNGVLEVFCRTAITPDSEWLEFLEALAGQAAIAIDSTQLFENLQRSNQDLSLAYDATIEGWSRAMDLRDHETEGHTQRVTDLTLKLAQFMQVGESQLTAIRRGALLHDIGKMGVPDAILLKEGKLTDDEWVLMRKHPQLAYEMLTPIAYLHDALVIPYCHHEKWDGSGYPQGLLGEQIPLMARIFAVIDVWDALTTDRPYRKKWTKAKALQYIKEQSGRHFDPRVVEAFLKNIRKL